MATLENAMPYLLENEGGYANIPGDKGGETYAGISRNQHPEWPGWVILDAMNLPLYSAPTCTRLIRADPRIATLVTAFYRKTYWCYDGIQSQALATKLLDGAVNMEGNGKKGAAVRALQIAIAVQYPNIFRMDGCYGPNTELMANKCDAPGLLMDLARYFTAHYNSIIDHNPEDAKFRTPWLRRAQKLPEAAQGVSA